MTILDSHWGTKLGAKEVEMYRGIIASGQRDEFGVKPLNLYYNEAGRTFCFSDAPSIEAVRKAHEKMGVKCDEIVEVKTLV